MLVSLWTLKGGQGCSVVAALVALHRSGATDEPTALLDLCGDQPAILGCPSPAAGVADWLRLADAGPPNALARLAGEAAPGLQLIGRGTDELPAVDLDPGRAQQLEAFPGTVVVDAGLVIGAAPGAVLARWFAAHSTRSVLVTTGCYLALVRVARAPVRPSAVVLVREPGRALGRDEVEAAAGAPVIAEIARDATISRAVDAGLLLRRLPKGLERTLGAVA